MNSDKPKLESLLDMSAKAKANRARPPQTPGNRVGVYKPFPVDAMPLVVRQFVETASESIGCDPAYVALHALGVLSGSIGNCLRVLIKHGWSEPCVLWLVTIGESGSLKSPGFRLAAAPLRKAQQRAMQNYKEALLKHEADEVRYELTLREWKSNGGKSDPPLAPEPPVAVRYIVSDITVEALAPLLRANPRGLSLGRDEVAGWVGSFDRYTGGKGADAPAWLSMYDAECIQVDRKGGEKTTFVPAAAVSIFGTIQPGVLVKVFTSEHRASGLLARILVAMPPNQPALWRDAEFPAVIEESFAALVESLLNMPLALDDEGAPKPRMIPLDEAAKKLFVHWHDQHAVELTDLGGDLAAAYSKIKGICARLALIIHAVKVADNDEHTHPGAIDEWSMASAIALAEWFKHEAGRVYAALSETDEQREQRGLVDWIRCRGGCITVRDLTRGPKRFRSAPELAEEQLNGLVAAGFGNWKSVGCEDRGRPTRVFALMDPSLETPREGQNHV